MIHINFSSKLSNVNMTPNPRSSINQDHVHVYIHEGRMQLWDAIVFHTLSLEVLCLKSRSCFQYSKLWQNQTILEPPSGSSWFGLVWHTQLPPIFQQKKYDLCKCVCCWEGPKEGLCIWRQLRQPQKVLEANTAKLYICILS